MENIQSHSSGNDERRNHLPKLIRSWAELAECESTTHILEIDIKGCNGWIRSKKDNKGPRLGDMYLSTHTFYGSNYQLYTKFLQECGFNVTLANWDA